MWCLVFTDRFNKKYILFRSFSYVWCGWRKIHYCYRRGFTDLRVSRWGSVPLTVRLEYLAAKRWRWDRKVL